MSRSLLLALLLALLVALPVVPAIASTQQALVRKLENPSLEIGQGYLTHYDQRCYLLLPTHVATESGAVAGLLGEGSPALLGETTGYYDLGDDITVADVSGNLIRDCGHSAAALSRAVDSLIASNGLATIRSVNGDGTIAQLAVTIFDDDGSTLLRVQPTNNDNELRKGQSGSLLMAGDTPIGMLQSVDARYGVGKVMRLDAMLAKLDEYVARRRAPRSAAPRAGSLAVISWSAMAVDAAHRAVNLVASDAAGPWIAHAEQWPVTLELSLGDERVAIAGVELDGSEVGRDALPGSVEILISSAAGGERWRSVTGGDTRFIDGRAAYPIAPTWARRIRLVFGPGAEDSQRISLHRVRVLLAD